MTHQVSTVADLRRYERMTLIAALEKILGAKRDDSAAAEERLRRLLVKAGAIPHKL
jgi:hypothetical protein